MADHSHDAAEDGFHEIQLSGKQVVFLFMVLTVASAVIFLCGVLVGRSVRTQHLDAMDNPPPVASSPSPQAAADPAPAAAEPPAPAAEVPDELSYPKRLQGETTPRDALKAEAPPAREVAKPEAPPPAKPEAAPATQPAQPEATAGRRGAWIVQVGAFGTAAAAGDVVRQLSGKGYPAFVVNPTGGMPVIYRVQVGAYNNRSEADRVARRIEKEDQFKPVVRQNR